MIIAESLLSVNGTQASASYHLKFSRICTKKTKRFQFLQPLIMLALCCNLDRCFNMILLSISSIILTHFKLLLSPLVLVHPVANKYFCYKSNT